MTKEEFVRSKREFMEYNFKGENFEVIIDFALGNLEIAWEYGRMEERDLRDLKN